MVISAIVFLLSIIVIGFWLHEKLNVQEKFSVLVANSIVIIFGYWGAIIDKLYIVTIVVYLVCAFLLGNIVYRQRRKFCNYIITLPVICYLFSALVYGVAFCIRPPFFSAWDEFSHWGIFLKNIKYNSSIPVFSTREFIHQTYPQALTIFYYVADFWNKSYSETAVFFTYSCLLGACAVIFFPNKKYCEDKKISLLCMLLTPLFWLLFPYASYAAPYFSVYLDAVLGAYWASVLCYVYANRNNRTISNYIVYSILLFTLLQIKDISIVFYLICVCMIFTSIFEYKLLLNRQSLVKIIELLFFTVCIPLIGHKSWKLLLTIKGKNTDQFSGNILSDCISKILNTINGNDSYAYDVFEAFYKGLRNVDISWVRMSMIVLLFILSILSILLAQKMYSKNNRVISSVYFLEMIAFLVVYIIIMYIVYLCRMSTEEALTNASMDRYFATFFVGWIAFCLYSYIGQETFKDRTLLIFILSSLLVFEYIMLPLTSITYISSTKAETGFDWYDKKGKQVLANTNEEKNNIWFVQCDDDREYGNIYLRFIMSYYLFPNELNMNLPVNVHELGYEQIEKEACENNVDYIYVLDTTDSFILEYGDVFKDKIVEKDDRSILIKMN